MEPTQSKLSSFLSSHKDVVKYVIIVAVCTVLMFFFSVVMLSVVNMRNEVDNVRTFEIQNVYQGELNQRAPVLNKLSDDSLLLQQEIYTPDQLEEFVKNANIISTNGKMTLNADFVKKGLQYEPTFRSSFEADYILKNNLTKTSVVSFEFSFPSEIGKGEISNVKLIVNGENIEKAKAKIDMQGIKIDGLKWEGKLAPEGEAIIHVSYDTVGVAGLNYKGFENSTGAQDFYMAINILGTRDYNLAGGLSVDKREFGDKQVKLVWDKKNLFSTPNIKINVGKKLAPSIQVSKVYAIMAPLYVLFAGMLVWLGYKNKKRLEARDLIFATLLYALYFPLWHYITSSTIDPTMEFFSSMKQISYFSMSLYAGFTIALTLIALPLLRLFGAVYGGKYAVNSLLPTIVICLGFFPLAVTVPDYSVLLMLLGLVALAIVWIRFRLQESN